ncbi:MAG: hypothetical protein QM791_02325 [Ferruginibacter sp.]
MKKVCLIHTIILLSAIACSSQNSLPATITFERKVVQESNGEDGKAVITYYFTINGDYAMGSHAEEGEDRKATILYTKEGKMCMIDEDKKTITIMNMPKFLGDAGKAVKKPKLPTVKEEEEKMKVTKTGKTKTICGYTAYEYEITSERGKSSWWYAAVDFDPAKIYSMGIGSSAMAGKLQAKKEELKDNPMAIALLNKNYLMAELEAGGKKGLETKTISKEHFIFSTTGYTIKEMKGFN